MKQKKISLTIGIPMYNHEKTIHTTLDSILYQLDEIKNLFELEILISDNCSTDESPRIVKDYKKKNPKIIKYHKNKTNIGISYNMKKVYELATKDYIWLFGDDTMLKGAIKSVYEIIQVCIQQKNKQPSAIFMNCLPIYSLNPLPMKEVLRNNLPTSFYYFIYNNLFDMQKSQTFPVLSAHNRFFLSSLILKKDKLLEIFHEIDFNDVHAYFIAYLKIVKSQPLAFIDKILVIITPASWVYTESGEFAILATLTHNPIIQHIYKDLLNKKEIQFNKRHIFVFIEKFYKNVKDPKLIIDAFKKITFFNKYLLSIIKFLSCLKMNNLAFKVLVIYAKKYNRRGRDGKYKKLQVLYKIILLVILIYLISKI